MQIFYICDTIDINCVVNTNWIHLSVSFMKGVNGYKMKTCNECEYDNEDSVEFCVKCGARLKQDDNEETTEAVIETENTEENEITAEQEIETAEPVIELEYAAEAEKDEEAGAAEEGADEEEDTAERPSADIASEETVQVDIDEVYAATDTETAVTEEKPPRKPMSKGAKRGITAAVIIVAAVVLFYCFGSLGVLAKIGIVNTGRYISVVKNRDIKETEEAPSVKLGKAFDAFFENDTSAINWFAEKTAEGVVVKAETVCTFDGKENTVATYSATLNFDGSIASEAFLAADKTLDAEQTLSVLQKTARYSDPAKKEFTTKDLSSSKYNNREYYYPSGVTLELLAGTDTAAFIEQYGMPDDVEGTTDISVLEGLILGEKYAAMVGMTFDELKAELGLDDTVTPDMRWGEIQGEILLKNYGLSEENIAEFKESYGFGDDVTLDTKFKDIKNRMIKFQYDEVERQKAEQEAANNSTEAPEDAVPDSDGASSENDETALSEDVPEATEGQADENSAAEIPAA